MYENVSLGAPGAMTASGVTSAGFDGSTSYVRLPDKAFLRRTHLAVELWFRTTATTVGPLVSGLRGSEILMIGADGKLRGQYPGIASPVQSTQSVNDGSWHHVVLSAAGGSQTLYLDGVVVGSQTGTVDIRGAAPHIGRSQFHDFAGQISDVAVYDHPLGASTVADHWAARNPADALTRITAPGGRVVAETTYSAADDRVTTHVDANGGAWAFGTPTLVSGAETTVTAHDPAGDPTTYAYDPSRSGRLTTITDSAGIARRFAYDSGGFVSGIVDFVQPPVELVNDARGNVLSRSTCRQFDYGPRTCLQRTTSYYTYHLNTSDPLDPRNDKVLTHRDARSTSAADNTYLTEYTYTATGQPATTVTPGATTVQRRTTTTAYTTGAEPAVGGGTTPAGLVKTTTTAGNRVTSYAYRAAGDLAQVTDPTGLVTTFGYDGLGRMISRAAAGATTTFTYDDANRLTQQLDPATANAVTNAAQQVRTTTAFNTDGTVASVTEDDIAGTDPDRVTSYTYDDRGRVLTTTDPAGGVTTTERDAHGALARTVDPAGAEHLYTYTPIGHRLATTALKGFTGDGAPAHDVVLESRSYDAIGRLGSVTDAMGRTTAFAYWDDNLLCWSVLIDYTDPITTVTANRFRRIVTYDGAANPVIETDQAGFNTIQTFDPAGRLTRAERWSPPTLHRFTEHTYDLDNGITSTVTKDGSHTVVGRVDHTLDAMGRELTRAVHTGATTLTTTTVRDTRGLPTSVTDPLSAVTGQAYDVLGRPTVTTAPTVAVESNGGVPSNATPQVTVGYNAFGDVVDVRDPNSNTTHTTVDQVGRPTAESLPSYTPPSGGAAITPTTSVVYDPMGRVTSSTDPAGATTTFTYDQLGNQVSRTDPLLPGKPAAGVWTATYNPLGEQQSAAGPTGAQTHATYDKLGQPATTTVVERTRRRPAT